MPRKPKLDVETQMQIVLESLKGATVSELCRRYGISQSHFYRIRDRFLEGAKTGLCGKENGDRLKFEDERAELERTIGRLTLENQILKKTLR
jgi:transposase-like protein